LKKLKKPEENKSKPIKTESKDKPKEAKKWTLERKKL
jgi:hypothetical protein